MSSVMFLLFILMVMYFFIDLDRKYFKLNKVIEDLITENEILKKENSELKEKMGD